MKMKRFISIALMITLLITTTVLAQEGFSERFEETSSIISMPDNCVKGSANEFVIEGNSIRQEVVNGDFSNGTTGWGGISTLSLSNNILSVTGDGGTKTPYISRTIKSIEADNNYFIYVKARVTNSICTKIWLYLASGIQDTFKTISSPNENQWYELYGFRKRSVGTNSHVLAIRHDYENEAVANGKSMEIDGNAGIFVINMTALGIEHYTEAQMLDLVRQGYWEGTKSTLGGVVKSVGKNLFDGELEDGGYVWVTGELYNVSNRMRNRNKYIKVKPNTKYVSNKSIGYVWYDNNRQFISSQNTYTTEPTISPSNAHYVNIVTSTNYGIDYTLQVSLYESDVAISTYSKYEFSSASYPVPFNDGQLSRVPNGSADEIDILSGKVTQKNKKYVLQSGDITFLTTSLENIDYIILSKFSGMSASGDLTGKSIISDVSTPSLSQGVTDVTSNVWKHYVNPANWVITIPKGTYPNLAAAQAALAGTEIIYQLETPIVEEIDTNPVIAFENGTITIEPVVYDSGEYSTANGLSISNGNLPIEEVISIKKIYIDELNQLRRDDVDISPSNMVIENGNKIMLTDGEDGATYKFTYSYPKELTTIPTINYSVPIDQTGQIDGNTNMIQKNQNDLDRIMEQIELLWKDLLK